MKSTSDSSVHYLEEELLQQLRQNPNAFSHLSQLKKQNKRLKICETVLDAAPTAMIMVTKQGDILLVNKQTERLFGYDNNDLMGKNIDILIPESFRNRHVNLVAAFFDSPYQRSMGRGRDLEG